MHKISVRSWIALPVVIASLVALSGCGSSGTASSASSGSAQNYTVGGTVNGIASGEGVDLVINKGSDLTVSANGPFTFETTLTNGSPYAITVDAEPTGQTCTVKGGSGTIHSANVTNVVVNCAF